MRNRRQVRVRAENVPALMKAFATRGTHVKVSRVVKTTLFGGCSDPSCCSQHESAEHPERWRTLLVEGSWREVEEVFRSLRRTTERRW